MARDVIAFDTTVDHPCPEVWGLLQRPGWYPRFFRGLGAVERVSGSTQNFEVRLSTPRGGLAVHEMRHSVRRANMAMRLDATAIEGCLLSIRLTSDGGGTRITVRTFAVNLLHPDLEKVSDGSVADWLRDGLQRLADYFDGTRTPQLVNMGDGRSLQFSVLMTLMTAAVERALDDRQREATYEVERILAAAVRVMERAAPEAPRVSDIVAEAGSSNKAFYRYFAGKDDVILAVMERGVAIVVSYLQHQMTKERTPAGQIKRWIEGALAQVADPHLISMSRGAAGQVSANTDWRAADDTIMRPMRDLLAEPIAALGSKSVQRDADAVFLCTVSAMRRYLDTAQRPGRADVDHLVRFCLRGLGVD